MYRKLDKILTKYVEQIFRLFQSYRVLPFDELNLLKDMREMWDRLDKITKKGLYDIGVEYFNREPHGDGFWGYADLYLMLRTPSPVLKYSYDKEFARKKERFEEALIATHGSKEEFERMLREYVRFFGWEAIEVADGALAKARENDGVLKVRWRSEHDSKVCGECRLLDGKVFRITSVPDKPHPGCRCWLERA